MINKKLAIGSFLTASLVALGIGQSKLQEPTIAASNDVMAPAFLVDPLWPKPLPNHWITGNTIGVDVDDRDHIFTVHRNTENMFGGRTEIGLALGVA